MITLNSSRFSLNRTLSRSALVGTIASIGLIFGIVPGLSEHSHSLVFGSAAHAEDVTDTEVTEYARSVLQIEPYRQDAYAKIKKIIGSGNVPKIACSQPDSLSTLPDDAQAAAVAYCEQSNSIVQKNGLTISRFNAITIKVQSDPDLKNRVQDQLRSLQ